MSWASDAWGLSESETQGTPVGQLGKLDMSREAVRDRHAEMVRFRADGFTYRAIGEIFGMHPGTVMRAVQRAARRSAPASARSEATE